MVSLLFQNHHFINMFRINLFSDTHRCSYYDEASLLLKVHVQDKYDLYSLSGERFQNKVKLNCSNLFRDRFYTLSFGFGSINGILCLYEDSYFGQTILWNPATKTIKRLPYSLVIDSIESDEKVYNDFVSLTAETHLHGFGYDDLTDDYKVIRYVTFTGEHAGYGCISIEELNYEALYPFWEIYSLRSNSWKKLDYDMPPTSLYKEGTQVYMDGVCHWLSEEDCAAGSCLVSFYLSKEVFITTPIPGDEDDDDFVFKASWINLVVVNGFIALISYHEDMTFHISIVGELGIEESWTKLLIVGPMPCVKYPIGAGTKGEIFFIREDEELVWFDLRKTFPQMTVELGYKGVGDTSQIIVYKENILPLGGISN
jgi:F-box interacting protein